MPYASAAQRGYFHAHKAALEAQGVNVSEWDQASKGKKLPYHVKKAEGGATDYLEAARKILHGKKDNLDSVLPGEKYDDNATYAAQRRVTDPWQHAAPMPVYNGVQQSPYAMHMAGGGNPYVPRQQKASDIAGYESRKMIHRAVGSGMLKSHIPGRTDKLPISVPSGSYVIPADIVSGLGQGNSDAGNQILSKMFNSGPMGMQPMKGGKAGAASRMHTGKLPKGAKIGFAEGGATDDQVPVVAAGGEYILHPDQVAQVGGGDVSHGHEVLDEFVKHARKQLISTLKKLPGPAKD